MNHQVDFAPVQQVLTASQSVLVAAPQKPKFDKIASALALYLSLKKAGKTAEVACPDEMTVEFSPLVGVDKINQRLGGKNLIISFDYVEDSIEKVSYNIENNKFNLLIQPKAGFSPLSTEKVNYSHSGGSDLILVVGAQKLEDLGSLYAEGKNSYAQRPVVNIDIDSKNTQFGKINLFNPAASSCSEIIASLISTLKLPIDQDIATNLLLGVEEATQGFTAPGASASTFEIAAFCLRAGGRRIKVPKAPEVKPQKPAPLSPMPSGVSAKTPPKEPENKEKPSADWFEPKIFKGSTRV